jgi:hypothetical protein
MADSAVGNYLCAAGEVERLSLSSESKSALHLCRAHSLRRDTWSGKLATAGYKTVAKAQCVSRSNTARKKWP